MKRKTITIVVLVLMGLGSASLFQNCAKNSFSPQADEISQSSTGDIADDASEATAPPTAMTPVATSAPTTSADVMEIERCLGRVLTSIEHVTCSDVSAGKTAYCNLKNQPALQRMLSGSYDQENIEISKIAGTAIAIDENGGDFSANGKVRLTRAQLNSASCVYIQLYTTATARVGKTFYIQLENLTSRKLEKILLTIRSSN